LLKTGHGVRCHEPTAVPLTDRKDEARS